MTSATVLLQISDLEGCNFKDVYLAGCIVLIVKVKECMNGHFAPTLIPATQSLSLTGPGGKPTPTLSGTAHTNLVMNRLWCVRLWREGRDGKRPSEKLLGWSYGCTSIYFW